MKSKRIGKVFLMLVALAAWGLGGVKPALSQLSVGFTAGGDGGDSFYVAIGDYYHVPEREIVVVRERHVPDDEIPVVFFIASRAHVTPGVVLNMRLGGASWMDVALHFGLGPDVFYVPVRGHVGPPYGRAYGYYKRDRKEWKKIRLKDADVVNFVNLRFMSEHYGYSADEVIRMRSEGKNFRAINARFHEKKFGKAAVKGKEKAHMKEKVRMKEKEKVKFMDHGPAMKEKHQGKGRGRGHQDKDQD